MTDQFELPSGLPEGPWSTLAWNVYDAQRREIAHCLLGEEGVVLARAIASIPVMVEEIGRLKLALSFASTDSCKEAIGEMGMREIKSLRALNAEMREMLIILRKECEHYEQAVSGETFHDSELDALIAKSQEAAS